ncbi:hypothetical protein BIW11_00131 [Tropilaelaps mercedesae]|uniref:Uncharacterized protein n=1 Tax=Tropilaelaps mercedesae TaxID=418985 RepID=A0A1V9Y1G9_9ACAR|nr:hypothetical protein BIW11_00131 [Tropilaelaps mercedesae]
MSDREESPEGESFHSFEAHVDAESSSLYGDPEFFSDTYGDAEIGVNRPDKERDAIVPNNGSVKRVIEDHPPTTEVIDEMAVLRARLEAMSSYASHDEDVPSSESRSEIVGMGRSFENASVSQKDNKHYSSGGYLDSYLNMVPSKPPPDRKRQRELSLTRAHEQRKRESGFSESVDAAQVKVSARDVPFELQLPDFNHGYTEPGTILARGVEYMEESYTMEFRSRSPDSFSNQPEISRSLIPSEFERGAMGRFEFNIDDYHSDQFERVSRETDDIIRQIAATLGDAQTSVKHFDAMQEENVEYPDFRDDEDPILQNRFVLDEAEMELSPSPDASFSQLRVSGGRRMSFEQSGIETRFTAAELEDERTPSPEAQTVPFREKFGNVRKDSTMEKLESLLGSHAPEKAFLDTETMEEISTYGRIRKIKKQRSEDQRILDEFDRHFDLCFDDSGEEDEFVSINDAEDVEDRAAGRIPEDFYTEMLQRERPFAAATNDLCKDFGAVKSPVGSDSSTSHTAAENNRLALTEEHFDLQRSCEVLDLVEAARCNMPIHMERRKSFYDELSDHIEPRRSLDGQCKTRAITPSGEVMTLELPKLRLQTQKSDASTADSEALFVPVGAEKEKSQSPSRDEGIRASRGFFEELDIFELEEKAKQQRSIPFEDSHIRIGSVPDTVADRPKTPIKAWRAELNLKTGEKMYESERYDGKDRNPDYGEAFGRFPVRNFFQDQHTYEAFERKSRRDYPIRGKPRDANYERVSQKQKFVNAPATTITSAFSAKVIDSDSYSELPPTTEKKMATFPRKNEKRRRKTSLQGGRVDKTPPRGTSKDRFLKEVDSRIYISSPEAEQKRLQDWRANFHQFPLSSESTEAPPACLDGSLPMKIPSYELMESPGTSLSQEAPARTVSLRGRHRAGANLLDPHSKYRSSMTRTQSIESAEEWSQSGYFVKPPPRRVRSRQSINSSHSAANDLLNIETVASEHSETKEVTGLVPDQMADSNMFENNHLGIGPPDPPKRTRSISRSINRLDDVNPDPKFTPKLVPANFQKPVIPRRRSRSTSVHRPSLNDYDKFNKIVDAKQAGSSLEQHGHSDAMDTNFSSVQQTPIAPSNVIAGSAADSDKIISVADGTTEEVVGTANESGELATGPHETKDHQKVIMKIKRSLNKEAEQKKSGNDEIQKFPTTEADTVNAVDLRGDTSPLSRVNDKAPYSDEESAYSDEEMSSAFTVTFKPGTKIVDIEETPVQSSKSSSRRSSNSGVDERHRSRTRRNQELLQKALQGMDENRDITENIAELSVDADFTDAIDNLPEDVESMPAKAKNGDPQSASNGEPVTVAQQASTPADKQVHKTSIATSDVPEEKPDTASIQSLTKRAGESKGQPPQVDEIIYKTRTDSPYSTKRDKTYYSDTGETMSTASHVTAIEKPTIEIVRSSSVESGYEVVDMSGSGSKPKAPQRHRRSSATGSAIGSSRDLKIMSQDKFGLVKPTYSDINEWARRALSSDDEVSSYHEDPHIERRFDETLEAIDKILTRTPREELEQPAEPTRPSLSKYEELSNLRDVLRQRLEQRNLARTASLVEKKATNVKENVDEKAAAIDNKGTESILLGKDDAITGVYLDGVIGALNSGDLHLTQNYEAVDQKGKDQSGNLIEGIIRGFRRSTDVGNHSEAVKKQESKDGFPSRGFFGDLMQKIQDKFEDISGEFRDAEARKRNSLVMPSIQVSSDKDNCTMDSGRPKSAMSGVSSELGVPDRGRSPLPKSLAQPRIRMEYTTDSEVSVDYETRYKRPFPRRRRTRDPLFDSSSDVPNSSTNEDFDSFFRLGSQRRRSQPSFMMLDTPKPPKRTKSTSNLSSSSLSVPPLPPKRVCSDHLLAPQVPRRTKSKERLARGKPPPLPMKSAHGKVPVLPPVESATATLVSPDRWQKGRLVHQQSVGVHLESNAAKEEVKATMTSHQDLIVTTDAATVTSLGPKHSIVLETKPAPVTLTSAIGVTPETPECILDSIAPLDLHIPDNDSTGIATRDQTLQFQDAVSDLPWAPTFPSTLAEPSAVRSLAPQENSSKTGKYAKLDIGRPVARRRRRRDTDEEGDIFYNAFDIESQHGTQLDASIGITQCSAVKPVLSRGSNSDYEIAVPSETEEKGLKERSPHPNAESEKNKNRETANFTELETTKFKRADSILGKDSHFTNATQAIQTAQNKDALYSIPKAELEFEAFSTKEGPFPGVKRAQEKTTNFLLDTTVSEDMGFAGVYVPGMVLCHNGPTEKEPRKIQAERELYGEEQRNIGGIEPYSDESSMTGVHLRGSAFEEFLQGKALANAKEERASTRMHPLQEFKGADGETQDKPSLYPPGVNPQGAYLGQKTGQVAHTVAPFPDPLHYGTETRGALPQTDGTTDKSQLSLADEIISPTTNLAGMGPQGMYLHGETGKMVYTGSGPQAEKIIRDYQQQGAPGIPQKNTRDRDILGIERIQDRFDAMMENEVGTAKLIIKSGQQPIYSKANKAVKDNAPLPPTKVRREQHGKGISSTRTNSQNASGQLRLMNAPKISVSCGDVSDGGTEKSLLSRLIPIRTKKKKKPQFLKIDPEQLARLPTMRPATPEPASPTKNFLTVENPNAPPQRSEEGSSGETFTKRLIRRGSNALMGLTGSFRRHRSSSYIEGSVPVDSPYQATVLDTTDGTSLNVKDPTQTLGSSPSILRYSEHASRGRSAEPRAASAEKSIKVQFISSPVHGRTLKSETKPTNAEADPLFEEPVGPMVIDVTPSRQDIAFPVHGRKLKLATEGIAQPIRPTEESYLFSQYNDGEGARGRIPDIDFRTQVTGLGCGDEKRGSIDDEFERDIFIPKQPKPPVSLTKMLKGALTGKGLPWSSQLGGREWARKRQSRMELKSGSNSLLGAVQVGAAGVESRSIFGEEARLRQAEEDAQKPKKMGRTISLADLMDIRQSFRNEELARMVAGAPPEAVLAHVKASPYVDSMTMETVKKLLVPDFTKIRERLEERFRKKIPKEKIEKNYQPFRFDRGVALPKEEVTYERQGPLRMDSVRNRIELPDLTDLTVQALYGGSTYEATPASYTEDQEGAASKPLTLTLPDQPPAVNRFDVLAPAAPDSGRSAHEVIQEAARIAAQPPPTPQIPPLTLPIEAMATLPMLPVTTAERLVPGVHIPTEPAKRTVEVPEPDFDLCNRRSSLILVNARDLDLVRPQRLNELTSVNVNIKRLRQKLPTYKNLMAAEV